MAEGSDSRRPAEKRGRTGLNLRKPSSRLLCNKKTDDVRTETDLTLSEATTRKTLTLKEELNISVERRVRRWIPLSYLISMMLAAA